MALDLAKLRALAEAATPGPALPVSYSFETLDELIAEWSQALRNRPESLTTHAVWKVGTDLFVALTGNGPTSAANAAYIAAADPTTVLALIAEIERLEAERDARPAITAEDEMVTCFECGFVGPRECTCTATDDPEDVIACHVCGRVECECGDARDEEQCA